MNNRYRITFRPHQNKDLQGNNIVYNSIGGVVQSSLGNEPNYIETDVTDWIGVFKTNVVFDKLNAFNRQGDNGVSQNIQITGEAYTYVQNYLFDTEWSHNKTIDVILYDNECDKIVKIFLIKADLVTENLADGCLLEMTMKEDNGLQCV